MNHVMLIGNLGTAVKLKTSEDGRSYCRLSLATHEKWKDDRGQLQKRTDWHQIVAFGSLAESLKALDRGDRVAVIGKLRSRSYVKDDETRHTLEVHAERVEFLRVRAWKGRGDEGDELTDEDFRT